MIVEIFRLYLQLFFLFTPFFALTMFLTLTEGHSTRERLKLILRMVIAVLVICYGLIFGGSLIFSLFGITVNAFRVGAGAILFLSAVDLIRGKAAASKDSDSDDIAVVPLAIPVIVGPATIGTLMIMGSDFTGFTEMLPLIIAVIPAVLTVTALLLLAPWIEKLIRRKGVIILSRLTGLILAALSAEMMMAGVKAFFE